MSRDINNRCYEEGGAFEMNLVKVIHVLSMIFGVASAVAGGIDNLKKSGTTAKIKK